MYANIQTSPQLLELGSLPPLPWASSVLVFWEAHRNWLGETTSSRQPSLDLLRIVKGSAWLLPFFGTHFQEKEEAWPIGWHRNFFPVRLRPAGYTLRSPCLHQATRWCSRWQGRQRLAGSGAHRGWHSRLTIWYHRRCSRWIKTKDARSHPSMCYKAAVRKIKDYMQFKKKKDCTDSTFPPFDSISKDYAANGCSLIFQTEVCPRKFHSVSMEM